MSGTTRSVQQPLDSTKVIAVLGMAIAALAIAVAIAWGSANLAGTAPAQLSAPAAISDSPLGALGARDLGAASVSIGASHGAPGAYRPVGDVVIKTRAPARFLPGSVGYSDHLRLQNISSGEGAPATRHGGLRAQ